MKTTTFSAGRFKLLGAFLLAAGCATQALALDAKGDFAIDGGGGRQCSSFSEAAKKQNTEAVRATEIVFLQKVLGAK